MDWFRIISTQGSYEQRMEIALPLDHQKVHPKWVEQDDMI